MFCYHQNKIQDNTKLENRFRLFELLIKLSHAVVQALNLFTG